MKSLLTIFVSIIIITTGVAQTTRRVNNNPGISGTNVYATAQAAQDAAVANDIIIIEPSTVSYGTLVATKPLKIYGNGYFLATNTELKADQRNSSLDIDFNTGSGGSEIYGITTAGINIYGVSNITIARNSFGQSAINIYTVNKAGTVFTSVSNIFITRNYGNSTSYFGGSPSSGKTITGVLITNNIFAYVSAGSDPLIQSWVVRNNTIQNGGACSLVNSVLENNFFYAGASPTLTNVTSSYNVSTGAGISGGIGNVNNYDIVTDPQLLGAGTGISVDEAFQVRSTSTLKTLGSSSSEVGAYGGITPYIVSGIPAIPSITSMINTGTGDATTPVKVTISVKSNN